jgi:hypothetical protein
MGDSQMNGSVINNVVGGCGPANGSPHAEVYKSSKRNNPPSSLEYQYASNSNNGISKAGGFFPNLRSKPGAAGLPRETNLA